MKPRKRSILSRTPAFAPVSKGDTLETVRVYKRTADPYDSRAIVVCVFSRRLRDMAKHVAGYSGLGDYRYATIAECPFRLHADASGPLYFSNPDGYNAHLAALVALGVRHMSVSAMSLDGGSESSRRAGVKMQSLRCDTDVGELYYYRTELCSDWWETLRGDDVVFRMEYDFRWGDLPVVWKDGLTLELAIAREYAGPEPRCDSCDISFAGTHTAHCRRNLDDKVTP